MIPRSPPSPELAELLEACCLGNLQPDQAARLAALVRSDAESRAHYVLFMHMHAIIERREAYGSSNSPICAPFDDSAVNDSALRGIPALGWFNRAYHGAVGFFSQEVPFACLIATVIMSVALGVCSQIYITHHQQYARTFGTPDVVSPLPSSLSPLPSPVARITGMMDVKWGSGVRNQGSGVENPEIPKTRNPESRASSTTPRAPNPQSLVLGDRLELASGLLQLTYNSGAQVILQGPCSYEVNSPAGGFLALGKLTARVEGSGIGNRGLGFGARGSGELAGSRGTVDSTKPQASDIHHSSFSTHHPPPPSPLTPHPSPLFTVTTPTATITDLGTEFGVEVDKQGVCEVQVLQGRVRAEFFASVGKPSQIVELAAGEGRRYLPAENLVTLVTADSSKFADMRITTPYQRWLEYSRQLRTDPSLVAYYTFERHDRGNWILPNQSAAGSALDGRVEGAEWVEGRLPGKLALYFHGPGSDDKVVLPEQERFKFPGPFSVAVWFKVAKFTAKWQALVTKGWDSWRVQQNVGTQALAFDSNWGASEDECLQKTSGRTEVADGLWHLAVIVYEPTGAESKKRLYLDGRLDGEGQSPLPLRQNDMAVCLGTISTLPGREINGLIDEVAIFTRALSPDEIATMFETGSPANFFTTGTKQ